MSEMHTPGPWVVYDSGYPNDRPGIEAGNLSIVVFGDSDIESDEAGVHGKTRDEEWANAALIARAPDLLAENTRLTARVAKLEAALRQLAEQAEHLAGNAGCHEGHSIWPALEAAEAALTPEAE